VETRGDDVYASFIALFVIVPFSFSGGTNLALLHKSTEFQNVMGTNEQLIYT
jgi:hypothetical protein